MTPSESPPPYTPHDPMAGSHSPERRTSPEPGDDPCRSSVSLRGGYLRPVPREADPLLSPTAFFEERNFEPEQIPPLMVLDVDIHPGTKREELPFPLNQKDRETRSVTAQDWDTFVNYLLTELGSDELTSESEKGRRWGNMTPEEFFQAKLKMENIVGEWNEAFFMPRGIHFNAKFSFSAPTAPSSSHSAPQEPTRGPVPVYAEAALPNDPSRTVEEATTDQSSLPGMAQGHEIYPGLFAGMRGRGMGRSALWAPVRTGLRGPHGPHGPHGRIGPQGPLGPQSPLGPHGPVGPHAFIPHHPHAGTRGPGGGLWGRGRYGGWAGHGFGPWGGHGRRDWQQGQHSGHRGRSASCSSSGSRSSSASFSSSSSSGSVSSLSASSIDQVDVSQVRDAIASFRLDPARKKHLKMAVAALHKDLRQQHNATRQNVKSCPRESRANKERYRENKRAIKEQLRELKGEIREIKREAKNERRSKRRTRKAEERAAKGKQSGGRRRRRAHGQDRDFDEPSPLPGPSSVPGAFPSDSIDNEPDVHRYDGPEQGVRSIEDDVETMVGDAGDHPAPPRAETSTSANTMAETPRMADLSKADQTLEKQARHLDSQAKHWERTAQHWQQQVDHYAQVYAYHDISRRYQEERRQSLREEPVTTPEKARKQAEKRAKQLQKSKQARDKHNAKAEVVRQKLVAQRVQAEQMGLSFRNQAAEVRARMEVQPAKAPGNGPANAAYGPPRGLPGGDLNANNAWGAYFENMGKRIGTWGEQFGKDMGAWGDQFGKDMEAWSERVAGERVEGTRE